MIHIPDVFKKQNNKDNKVLPLLPLRDIVVFPYTVAPLFVGRPKSINALSEAMNSNEHFIFLSTQSKADVDDPDEREINAYGTVARVLQMLRLPDGTVKTVVEGLQRGKISSFVPNESFFMVKVEPLDAGTIDSGQLEAYVKNVLEAFNEYARVHKNISKETIDRVSAISNPEQLIYVLADQFSFKSSDNRLLLETDSLSERFILLIRLIQQEIMILKTDRKIKKRVKEQMEKSQRNYYLNEQIRAIKKEMGEEDTAEDELRELEKKIEQKKMSKEATEKAKEELAKLKRMPPMSAEGTVIRNYIDWLIGLPWSDKSELKTDIDEAEKILNEDHYGLEKPKERILEYLAVLALVKKIKGPILCLVGPPGVGKTSLARSIARATGRKFTRISLGGVRDEAEIRGHRRTYIGALPGKIIQSLKKVGVNNPVFCLDEIDKMSMDFRGDPSSALLEVLDPEQNYAFNDHYLDVDYDLSDILFITTANTLPDIPLPLQDRMEIIRLPGYTEIEKFHIAKEFLIPKQLKSNGLEEIGVGFSDNAIYTIIRNYTREAGVRNLEREIASILRKIARKAASSKDVIGPVTVTAATVKKFLGPPRFLYNQIEENDKIGIVTGLAWTQFGGELLSIESVIMPGKGEFAVTGKLGEVMKESAKAAVSYVRSRAEQFHIDPNFHEKFDIHIHVPEGAIPKDGPSAGIAMCVAIISSLSGMPVDRTIAMTGEITLRGRVLPIGGLKEKIMAAHRGGIKKVLIPKENEKDLKDIPQSISRQIQIIPVSHMDEVISQSIVLPEGRDLFKKTPAFPLPEKQSPKGDKRLPIN